MHSSSDEQIRLVDVHMDLERDIADFLGTESSILYSQGLSTIPCVIPAFAKRGDIIVADRSINFAIQKGLRISLPPSAGSIITSSKASRRCFWALRRNAANGAVLLRDDSLSPKAFLRRTAAWLIYLNS